MSAKTDSYRFGDGVSDSTDGKSEERVFTKQRERADAAGRSGQEWDEDMKRSSRVIGFPGQGFVERVAVAAQQAIADIDCRQAAKQVNPRGPVACVYTGGEKED